MKPIQKNIRHYLFVPLLWSTAFAACTKDGTHNDLRPTTLVSFAVSAQSPLVTQGNDDAGTTRYSCLSLEGGAKPMFLHVTEQEGIQSADDDLTRAEPVTDTTIADAGILGFNFNGDWSDALAPDFMYNIRIARDSGWTTSYHYPNNGSKVRFHAYSPYGCKGATLSDKSATGVPAIRYAVPASVYEQNDLLVARSGDVVGSATDAPKVNLDFKHALTAIRFVTGDDMVACKIKTITIKEVYTQGVCALDASPAWADLGGIGEFTLDINKSFDGSGDEPITTAGQTLMMIPQTLPAGASIDIVLDDGVEYTLSSDIAGTEWRAGYSVTYHISSSSISGETFFKAKSPAAFTYLGGEGSYKVSSYRLRNDGSKASVAWRVKGYSEDNGATWSETCPDWVTLSATEGTGSFTDEVIGLSVKGQVSDRVDDICQHYNDILRSAEPVYDYDLATNGGTTPMNTANCYIVNAPGTYTLPLVYGNAIKDGATNSDAYMTQNDNTAVLQTFYNHWGRAITDPYIYNNAECEIDDALLIWQDANGLVNNVWLSDDKRSLVFEISQANICQGNAVVAIRNANREIMWSWHIWVTAYQLGDDIRTVVKAGDGTQFNFIPINLGWCFTAGTTDTYAARSLMIKLEQKSGSRRERTIKIRQYSHYEETELQGNSPYYQWGRKDPMMPSLNYAHQGDKPVYDITGKATTEQRIQSWNYNVYIKKSILFPYIMGESHGSTCDYCNLWNTNQKTYAIDSGMDKFAKTIYDPCPVGFTVPKPSAYQVFTNDHIKGVWRKGMEFYCDTDKKDNTIFFPATGQRSHASGAIFFIGGGAYYWTTTAYDKYDSYYFLLDGSLLFYHNRFDFGQSIRPVVEDN